MNLILINSIKQAFISANKDSLVNSQFLTCYSKIVNLTPIDTKPSSTILIQLTRDPRGQISNSSYSASYLGNVAIDLSYTSGRLMANSVVDLHVVAVPLVCKELHFIANHRFSNAASPSSLNRS